MSASHDGQDAQPIIHIVDSSDSSLEHVGPFLLDSSSLGDDEIPPELLAEEHQDDDWGSDETEDQPASESTSLIHGTPPSFFDNLTRNFVADKDLPGADTYFYPEGPLRAAIREYDPNHTEYKYVDVIAAAAANAPQFFRMVFLSGKWIRALGDGVDPTDPKVYQDKAGLEHVNETLGWYREWISWLHLKTLSVEGQQDPFSEVRKLWQMVETAEKLKRTETRAYLETEQDPFAHWLIQTAQEIFQGYQNIEKQFNLLGLDGVQAAYKGISARARLVATLLAAERLFERMLTARHVEEMHLSKRIFLFEDEDLARGDLWRLAVNKPTIQLCLEKDVRGIQFLAGRLFAYRFIRDWCYDRAWKRLFFVVDVGEDKEMAKATEEVAGLLARSAFDTRMLRVHPVAKSKIPRDESCSICCESFQAEELLIQTHCDHVFHAICIFTYWDAETTPLHQCPNCRRQPRSLAERHNIQDPRPVLTMTETQMMEREYRDARTWRRINSGEPTTATIRARFLLHHRRKLCNRDRRHFMGRPDAYNFHPINFNKLWIDFQEGVPMDPEETLPGRLRRLQ